MNDPETHRTPAEGTPERPRGRRALRGLAIAALVVVGLVALAAVLVPLLVPMDAARDRIVTALEERLGREVSVGEVSLRLLPVPAVAIQDVVIENPKGWERAELARIDEVSLEIDLWPLLRREVEVDEVVVSSPDVVVIRRADGTTNLEGLFPEREEAAAQAPSEWEVRLGTVEVDGGEVALVDHAVGGREPVITRVRALEADAEGLLGEGPIDGRIKAALLGGDRQNFEIKVAARPIDGGLPEVEARVLLQRVDPAPLAPYLGGVAGLLEDVSSDLRLAGRVDQRLSLKGWVQAAGVKAELDGLVRDPTGERVLQLRAAADEVPLVKVARVLERQGLGLVGRGGLEVALSGPVDALRVEARVRVADLRAADLPTELEPVDAALAVTGTVPGRLTVEGWVEAAATRAVVAGAVAQVPSEPRLDLTVEADGVPVERILAFVPEGAVPNPRQARGTADLGARIQGPASDPVVRAELAVRGLELKAGAENGPGNRVVLEGADLTGSAVAAADAPRVRFDLNARVLEVRLAPGPEGEGPSEPPALDLDGELDVARGRLNGFAFTDLKARVLLKDGQLVITPSLQAYGGRLSGRVASRIADAVPPSQLELRLDALDAGSLLADLAPAAGDVLDGRMSGQVALSFAGLEWDRITRTARGQGRLSVADAEVASLELLPEVAGALTQVGRGAGLVVPEVLERRSLKDLTTSFRIAEGRVVTPDLVWSGPGVVARADGAVGLDGQLDYRGTVDLDAGLTRGLGPLGLALQGRDGGLEIPFRVSGPVKEPRVGVDADALAAEVQRGLAGEARRRAGQALEEVLTGPREPEEGEEEAEPEPGETLREEGEKKVREAFDDFLGG